jgi:hypothetical protein
MREINWREMIEEREMRIRTRGEIRSRGGAPTVIRTRGSIRTRGAAPVEAAEKKPLEELVVELRKQAHGSPIAVLIHGWDEQPAQMFLRAISPELNVDDAIWLVPYDGTKPAEAPSELPEAVVLDFSREPDRRTYDNLVVDIAFFHDGKAEDVDKWKRRAEAVIISSSAKKSGEMVKKSRENKQDVYRWSDSETDKLVRI